jgi:flagellar basal body-associated protein FliL
MQLKELDNMKKNKITKGLVGILLVAAMVLGFLPTLVLPVAVSAAATWHRQDAQKRSNRRSVGKAALRLFPQLYPLSTFSPSRADKT